MDWRLVAGVFVLAVAAAHSAAAQSAPGEIAIESGSKRQVVARAIGGQWHPVSDAGCTPGGTGRLVSGGRPMRGPARLTASDARWTLVRLEIERVFAQRQREHELTAPNVPGPAMTIDWVFADGEAAAAGTVLYFEASRRVPDPGTAPDDDPRGTLRVTVFGWLHAGKGRVSTLGSKSELRWEQEPEAGVAAVAGAPDLEPLGVERQATLPVWVMKAQTGTIVRYLLYEVGGPTGVRTLFDVRPARC